MVLEINKNHCLKVEWVLIFIDYYWLILIFIDYEICYLFLISCTIWINKPFTKRFLLWFVLLQIQCSVKLTCDQASLCFTRREGTRSYPPRKKGRLIAGYSDWNVLHFRLGSKSSWFESQPWHEITKISAARYTHEQLIFSVYFFLAGLLVGEQPFIVTRSTEVSFFFILRLILCHFVVPHADMLNKNNLIPEITGLVRYLVSKSHRSEACNCRVQKDFFSSLAWISIAASPLTIAASLRQKQNPLAPRVCPSSRMNCDWCVFKLPRRSVKGKHFMCFHSETSVCKSLRLVWSRH